MTYRKIIYRIYILYILYKWIILILQVSVAYPCCINWSESWIADPYFQREYESLYNEYLRNNKEKLDEIVSQFETNTIYPILSQFYIYRI